MTLKPGETVRGMAFYNAPDRKGSVRNPYRIQVQHKPQEQPHYVPGYLDSEDTPPTPAPMWFEVLTIGLGVGIIFGIGMICATLLAK